MSSRLLSELKEWLMSLLVGERQFGDGRCWHRAIAGWRPYMLV